MICVFSYVDKMNIFANYDVRNFSEKIALYFFWIEQFDLTGHFTTWSFSWDYHHPNESISNNFSINITTENISMLSSLICLLNLLKTNFRPRCSYRINSIDFKVFQFFPLKSPSLSFLEPDFFHFKLKDQMKQFCVDGIGSSRVFKRAIKFWYISYYFNGQKTKNRRWWLTR